MLSINLDRLLCHASQLELNVGIQNHDRSITCLVDNALAQCTDSTLQRGAEARGKRSFFSYFPVRVVGAHEI